MPYEATQVLDLVRGKSDYTSKMLNTVGVEWASRINVNLRAAFAVFLEEHDGQEVLVAKAIRNASMFLKNRVPTLYVSDMYLQHLENPALKERLAFDEQGERFEHVVPIKFSLPEKLFLQDPMGALEAPDHDSLRTVFPWLNRIARAILTPICYLSQHENLRINRLSTSDWTFPFSRYCEPRILRDAPGQPIQVYETLTGKHLEKLGHFSWANHFDLMEASPAFAPGFTFVREFFLAFKDEHPDLWTVLEQRPGGAIWPSAPTEAERHGHYTMEERNALLQVLRKLAQGGPLVMEVPVNRGRLTLTVRHPQHLDKLIARINIGPNYSKREIYFNENIMHSAGRYWIDQVATYINVRGEQMSLQLQHGRGINRNDYDISYPYDTRTSHAQQVMNALQIIVPTMNHLYSRIAI